jgi:hypothetical protein
MPKRASTGRENHFWGNHWSVFCHRCSLQRAGKRSTGQSFRAAGGLFQGSTTLKENSLGKLVSDGGRLQFRVQMRVVTSEGPALGHGVEVGGAAEAPLEEDQVGVLPVHGHRHHFLLAGRRQVAAVD